jgi:hypothetical protein
MIPLERTLKFSTLFSSVVGPKLCVSDSDPALKLILIRQAFKKDIRLDLMCPQYSSSSKFGEIQVRQLCKFVNTVGYLFTVMLCTVGVNWNQTLTGIPIRKFMTDLDLKMQII